MADTGSWGSSFGPLTGEGDNSLLPSGALSGLNQGQQQGIQNQLNPASPLENFGGIPASGFGFSGQDVPTPDMGSGGFNLGSLGSLLGLGGMGAGLGSELMSLFGGSGGLFGGGAPGAQAGAEGSQIGGEIGGLGGMALMPFLGPLGPLLGGFGGNILGDLFGNLIGGGINRMAKPNAAMGALNARGGIDSLLAKYIGGGEQRGFNLSESGAPFNPGAMASALQLLSGRSLGEGMNGKMGLGNLGFGSPVSLYGISNLPQLRGLFGKGGNFPQLQTSQIAQIMPMLSALANKMPGNANMGQRQAYFNKIAQLAQKLKTAESY